MGATRHVAARGTAGRRGRCCALAALPLGVPGVALAHGQEVLLLPLGNFVGLVAVAATALILRVRLREAAKGMAGGLLACVPPWLVSNDLVPQWVQGSGTAWLLVGALPPAAVGVAVLTASMWMARRTE